MNISIFGMGYVGIVSAACLIREGHIVTGVDISEKKVNCLLRGGVPILEKGVEFLLNKGRKENRFFITTDVEKGIKNSEMIWVCVGTPSDLDGGIDFTYIDKVSKDIGKAIKKNNSYPLLVIRSTCLPGTIDNRVIPLIEKESNLVIGKDFGLIFYPEFLREGSALDDFLNPSISVIGELNSIFSDKFLSIYNNKSIKFFRMSFKEAEMIKYCCNLFHAMKITFANEVAMICNSIGIDSRIISNTYCSDTKLNISSKYLYPGNAYGGSCLPKDLRAIIKFASDNNIKIPMLEGVLSSNEKQIEYLFSRILKYKPNKVGIIGISFKNGTDDIRESPYIKIAKKLINENIDLLIYDNNIDINLLVGENKRQLEDNFCNINDILITSMEKMSSVDLIIINHSVVNANQIESWANNGIRIIDLSDIKNVNRFMENYEGIYW